MTSVIFSKNGTCRETLVAVETIIYGQGFPKYGSQVDFWWVAEIFRMINYTSLFRVAVEICAHDFFLRLCVKIDCHQ